MINKRKLGAKYEEMAGRYLAAHGVKILEHNFRNRFGEIDLIARDGRFYVFIEVKYRTGTLAGAPEEAVDMKKQWTICRVSDHYRRMRRLGEDTPIRYDVLAIHGDAEEEVVKDTDIRWYKDAFPYISRN